MFSKQGTTRTVLGGTLAALLVLAAPAVLAAPHGPHGFERGAPDHLMERLGVDASQRDQLMAIFEGHHEQMESVHEQMRAAREALEARVSADELDEQAIRSAAADVGAVEADAAVFRARMLQQIGQVLTPEQFAEFKEAHRMRGATRGHGPERHGRHPRHERPGRPGRDGF